LIEGFQVDDWRGGAVFSKIVWLAVILLLGPTTVFSQDSPKDACHPPNTSTEEAQARALATKPKVIRVGGNVAASNLIHQVAPEYPPIAKTAHISGTVLLHAVIGKDGTVEGLQYVSGPPLLMKSAMDAVRQWQYKPTFLNGEPIGVDTTISVVFTLGGDKAGSAQSSLTSSAPNSPLGPSQSSSYDLPKDPPSSQNAVTEDVQAGTSVSKRVRVDANVTPATLIYQVAPVYPQEAKKQHIQGTVLLHAIITKDGTIRTLEYLSGPSELMDSAINAVKQWRYKATMVNGEPVEVDTKISVVFTLSNN
jgi:TonB family protein